MSNRFRVADGKAAIWTGETDTAPFDTPLSNLSRVKFHSSLSYPNVISTTVTALTLPASSGVSQRVASYTLFAHGRPGMPWIIGKMAIQGQETAFVGSICAQQGDNMGVTSISNCYGRFLALGADATNVVLHEYLVARSSVAGYEAYTAMDVSITTYVTDKILP